MFEENMVNIFPSLKNPTDIYVQETYRIPK